MSARVRRSLVRAAERASRLALGGTIAVLLTSCTKPPAPNTKPPAPSTKPPAPSTPSTKPPTVAEAEAAGYVQRRKRVPSVIGGCEERCTSVAKAADALFDGLQSAAPSATLRHLFDWSLLELDGDKRGDHWSEQWADPRLHGKRDQEIQRWLDDWIAALRRAEPAALLRSRTSGVQINAIAKRTDVVEMRWRHPALTSAGEREWRVLWTLRGYEWLISRIDRQPSKHVLGDPPLGSVRKGRL